MKILAIIALLGFSSFVHAWEDHPDKEDHRETDRIFKLAQLQTSAVEFEQKFAEEKEKKKIEAIEDKKLAKAEKKNETKTK